MVAIWRRVSLISVRSLPCLDNGSASVTVERQRTGKLTNDTQTGGGGVRDRNEEDGNEKLGEEHGDVGRSVVFQPGG